MQRWWLVLRLGSALILLDAFLRWIHLKPERPNITAITTPWTREMSAAFLRIFLGCFAETFAFHVGVSAACYLTLIFLKFLSSVGLNKPSPVFGVRDEFRYSLIPLSLLYSSLAKLFLLLLLSIWQPGSARPPLPLRNSTLPAYRLTEDSFLNDALRLLDDDQLDRAWMIRNVLGGMSAGFGLRVILDCHPTYTTIIVVIGWATKTAVANVVSKWVGVDDDDQIGAAWLQYSIP